MIGRRFGPPRRCARLNPTQCRSAVRRDRVIDRGCDSIFAQRNEAAAGDRKSTRLNSSHLVTSYAVSCLKNKMESRTVRRLGENNHRKVDVHFLAATHRDLRKMVNAVVFLVIRHPPSSTLFPYTTLFR